MLLNSKKNIIFFIIMVFLIFSCHFSVSIDIPVL